MTVFDVPLASGDRLCVQEVGVDYFRFQVRHGPTTYLDIFSGPFPFDPPGPHHLELGRGQTLRVSADGKTEDGIVRLGGHPEVRRRLLATNEIDGGSNVTYLVIEVIPPAGSKAALAAESVLLNVKAK